ncbi:hypothetical protein ID866_8559 [Astraeus odoratus]|nr:hypothetical protein ID866_8559 [Astraeus odoratus]
MQRFNPELTSRHGTVTEHSGSFSIRQTGVYAYDHGSPSGSEIDDTGNLVYSDPNKMDTELEDDPYAGLTSQSLNPDGTPKRPMNAFMIFARRRRPEVSAENQSMRTGEISKILSREWNTMDPSEKQFYLDQAKQLKDTFNQKYPDYVYKRRPNNSRRRRKPDASYESSSELQSATDSVEDYSLEYPNPSPVETAEPEECRYGGYDACHSSAPVEAPSHPRRSTYPPSEAPAYASQSDAAYTSSHHGRAPADTVGQALQHPSRGLQSTSPFYHTFPPSQMPSSYLSESCGGNEGWSSAVRDERARMPVQSWSQSSHDLIHGREGHHQAPSHGWSTPGQSDPGSVTGPHTSGYGFPTLTSPFLPAQASPQGDFSSIVPTSQTGPSPLYSATQMQSTSLQGRPNSSYDPRSYPSHSSAQSVSSSSAVASTYQHVKNVMPGPQPLINYSHAHQASGSGPGVDTLQQQQPRYWAKEPTDD